MAIQGFGNAGQHIARLLAADGYSIVAVSDSKGAIHCPSGLDIGMLIAAKGRECVTGLAGSDGISALPADDLVSVDCELLVPAALEDMIHEGNASSVKARVVLELANGPLTPEADEILARPGTLSFCRTSWRMRAVSPSRTSSGCRTGRDTTGRSRTCMRG